MFERTLEESHTGRTVQFEARSLYRPILFTYMVVSFLRGMRMWFTLWAKIGLWCSTCTSTIYRTNTQLSILVRQRYSAFRSILERLDANCNPSYSIFDLVSYYNVWRIKINVKCNFSRRRPHYLHCPTRRHLNLVRQRSAAEYILAKENFVWWNVPLSMRPVKIIQHGRCKAPLKLYH